MKRNNHSPRPKKKSKSKNPAAAATPADAPKPGVSRRDFMSKFGTYGLVAAAAIGGGWYFIDDVRATARELDLSRLGNGTPAIVQIHDPTCQHCLALQRQVRDALSNFNDDELQYLVANIKTMEGRQLADKHRVGHITLLLFDGKGNRRRIITGPNKSAFLEKAFRDHLTRTAGG